MTFEQFNAGHIETAESREINEQLRSLTARVEDVLASREAVTEIEADRFDTRMNEEDLKAELAMGPYLGYDVEGNLIG